MSFKRRNPASGPGNDEHDSQAVPENVAQAGERVNAKTAGLDSREPRTVGWWRDYHNRDARKRGDHCMLTREMLCSEAFLSLKPSGQTFVLAMLNNLDFVSKKAKPEKDRKGVRTGGNTLCIAGKRLKREGKFTLVNNQLKALGVKSDSAIAEARVDAWKKGFYDTIRTGCVVRHGEFCYSERWKLYPDGDYLPHRQGRPGANMYHKIENKSAENKAQEEQTAK